MGKYKELKIWIYAKEIAVEIYRMASKNELLKKDFRLKAQLCSSAVSIASNIAEGDELMSNRQSIKHFYYAKGSAAELVTQLIISVEIGFLNKAETEVLISKIEVLSAMINSIIKVRQKT